MSAHRRFPRGPGRCVARLLSGVAGVAGVARRRGERGAATVFVVGMAIVLLASAGLVVDGGKALNARMKLADDVEQAARLGANQIDIEAVRGSSVVRIDPVLAQSEASGYMAGRGYSTGGVTTNGDSVSVTATDTVSTDMLQLIGISSYEITASATAQAVTQ